MTDPFRRIAALICSAQTVERVIDPVLADVQIEARTARQTGHPGRARWIQAVGCVVFAKVLLVCAFTQGCKVFIAHEDERAAWRRTLLAATVATLAVTALLQWPQMRFAYGKFGRVDLILFTLPPALSLSMPIGLTLGLLIGLGGHNLSRRIAWSVVALAFFATLLCLANTGWITPATNQEYRARASGNRSIPKGVNELTLGEVRQMMLANNRSSRQVDRLAQRQFALSYYMRWSLAAATFVFAIFALTVIARHHGRRIRLAVAALSSFVLWYGLVLVSLNSVRAGNVPPLAAAWFPDAVILLIAFGVLNVGRRHLAATTQTT